MMKNAMGGIVFMLAAVAEPTVAQALSKTVHCPGESIADALDVGFEEINVDGTCTENVEIRQNDVTIQGDGNDTVMGELFVNGAQRVTIQNLKIQGDGTPGLNGIVSINSAAVRIANVTIEGIGDHGVIVLHGASADLSGVTVRNSTRGIVAEDNSSFQVVNSLVEAVSDIAIVINRQSSGVVIDSTIQNNNVGILFALGGGGNVINSIIQNNSSEGITVTDGASANLDGNTIQGSLEAVSSVRNSSVELRNNSIQTAPSADSIALELLWGGTAHLSGGNTVQSQSFAIFAKQGAMLIQRRGHDSIDGPVTIEAMSNAEFRDASITGNMVIVDHSLARFRSQPPGTTSINGDIAVSQDSGINFIRDGSDGQVTMMGNITCADTESSISAPPTNVTVTGANKGCTGYSIGSK